MAEKQRGAFVIINGRTVYDSGLTRRWQCPNCKWWRDWAESKCCVCGASRDGDKKVTVAGASGH